MSDEIFQAILSGSNTEQLHETLMHMTDIDSDTLSLTQEISPEVYRMILEKRISIIDTALAIRAKDKLAYYSAYIEARLLSLQSNPHCKISEQQIRYYAYQQAQQALSVQNDLLVKIGNKTFTTNELPGAIDLFYSCSNPLPILFNFEKEFLSDVLKRNDVFSSWELFDRIKTYLSGETQSQRMRDILKTQFEAGFTLSSTILHQLETWEVQVPEINAAVFSTIISVEEPGCYELVKMLFEYGANLNVSIDNHPIMKYVISSDRPKTLQLFIDTGIRIDQIDASYSFSSCGNPEILDILRKNGYTIRKSELINALTMLIPECSTNDKETQTEYKENKNMRYFRGLLARGVNPNWSSNNLDDTPLEQTCTFQKPECARLLLEAHAIPRRDYYEMGPGVFRSMFIHWDATHDRDAEILEYGTAGMIYFVGESYLSGDGRPKNAELGWRFIKAAADGGYADAQYEYGLYLVRYYEDKKQAVKYFKAAANQGHLKAKKILPWYLVFPDSNGRYK